MHQYICHLLDVHVFLKNLVRIFSKKCPDCDGDMERKFYVTVMIDPIVRY